MEQAHTDRPAVLLILLLLLTASSAHGREPSNLEHTAHVDWKAGTLSIEIRADISVYNAPLPAARTFAEEDIRAALPSLFLEATGSLALDSFETVHERVLRNPRILGRINDAAGTATITRNSMSRDLKSLQIRFEYRLYPDVVSAFIDHNIAYRPRELVGYFPTTRFSGIVIIAKGAHLVHGEQADATLSPSLFPRIFDENMDLLLEATMVSPEYLRRWGVLGYYDGYDLSRHYERIGGAPLITMARAVFGDNRTDIIIPALDAKRILALAHNTDLLQQGRIIVILDALR